MGNNFCQCKIICQNIREEDLSSKVNTKRILESSDKNKVKNKSNSEISFNVLKEILLKIKV